MLLPYVDIDSRIANFIACPIQMKAATRTSFSLDTKYSKVRNIIIAYIWHLEDPNKTTTLMRLLIRKRLR